MAALKEACKACRTKGTLILDHKEGRVVCRECGLVAKDSYISPEAEWRSFGDKDAGEEVADPSRVGAIESVFSPSKLSTYIEGGNAALSALQAKMNDDAEERRLKAMQGLLEEAAAKLRLPNGLVLQALDVIRQVLNAPELRSTAKNVVAMASLRIACKLTGSLDLSWKELCAAAEITHRDLTRCYNKIRTVRRFKKYWKQHRKLHEVQDEGLMQMVALMQRLTSTLRLPAKVDQVCVDAVSFCYQNDILTGKHRPTIAAAVIMLVLLLHPERHEFPRTLPELAAASGMAAATVANAVRDLQHSQAMLQHIVGLINPPQPQAHAQPQPQPHLQPSPAQQGPPPMAPAPAAAAVAAPPRYAQPPPHQPPPGPAQYGGPDQFQVAAPVPPAGSAGGLAPAPNPLPQPQSQPQPAAEPETRPAALSEESFPDL